MSTALCPGSFDPPTNGHIDVIERCLDVFEQVVVGVIHNPSKSPLFSAEERVALLKELLSDHTRVEVGSFEGLLVDYANSVGARVIVKGLRAVTDFDYEFQMAQMNYELANMDTMFVATSPAYSYLSSSLVKEVARLGGNVDSLVPPLVAARLEEKFRG